MKIRKGNTEADVLAKGAYLYSFTVKEKDILLRGNLYKPTRGGMAVLIPFANRVKGGMYEFEGVKYYLPKNKEGNAIHGLVLDKIFDVEKLEEDQITLSYKLSHEGYPTKLQIRINYLVEEGSLSVSFSVKNIGEKKAPLTVGAHPYFITFTDWQISPNKGQKCVTQDKIPTGEFVTSDIVNGNYDDCFKMDNEEIVLTSSYSTVKIIRENMPFVQLYTGVKGAIAIEPMSGAPDAYHNNIGLKIINKEEEIEYSFKIIVLN